jgi:hypothetical protein
MKKLRNSHTPSLNSDRRNAFGIGLLLFSIYLFSFNGIITSWDGEFAYATTQNLVQHQEFSASQMWWNGVRQQVATLNAEPQSKYGLGTALVGVPFYALALLIPGINLVHATLLSTALATALTGVVLYFLLRALDYSSAISGLTALAYGMATTAIVYARDYFSEPFVALALLASALAFLSYRRRPGMLIALLAGLCLAGALLLKLTNLLIIPIFIAYAFGFRPWRAPFKDLLVVAAPLALSVILIAYYNWARFGSPWVTGYPDEEGFSGNILEGMFGLLLSPKKGLVFYSPLLLALLPGARALWRRHSREALLAAAVFAFHVLAFSAWYDWQGGVNWGPRFLVPTLPFLMLPIATGLAYNRASRLLFWALLPLSIAIQVVGTAVSYQTLPASFIRGTLPRQLPPLGHLALFDLRHIDVLWLRHLDGGEVIDFLSAGLPLALTVLALTVLWRQRRWLVATACGASIVICLILLVRYADDPRVAGNPDMLRLVRELTDRAKPSDVIVVGSEQYVDLFFNYYRGPAKWYALIKEEKQVPEDEGWLFDRIVREHDSIWLVTDTPESAKIQRRPFEAWFAPQVYLRNAQSFGSQARLIEYTTKPPVNAASPLHVSALGFGPDIDLSGYDLSVAARGMMGRTLTAALYWQARAVPAENYTVFVQALNTDGQVVWQADRFPANNFRPTLSWMLGEVVSDPYLWDIPSTVAPGRYTLIAGLYLSASGQRLPVISADGKAQGDHVALGVFDVE